MKIRIERPNRLGRQMARQRIEEQISAAMEQYKGQASALRLEWLQDNPEIDRLSVAGSVYGNKVNGDVGVSEEMLIIDADLSGPLLWLVKKETVESMVSKELEKLGL